MTDCSAARRSTKGPCRGLGSRIAQAAEAAGGKRALALTADISPSQLYRYIAGASSPTVEPLVAIARAAGVDLEWLATGEGRDKGATRDGLRVPLVSPSYFAAGSGDGAGHVLERVTLDADWLAGKGDPGKMVLAEMTGHNMYPSLINGDLVLVDTSRTQPVPGRLYGFLVESILLIRRLDVIPGKYMLVSDDSRHASLDIPVEHFDQVRIAGQVVWIFREVR